MKNTESSREIESAILEVALSLDEGETREEFLQRTFRSDPAGLEEMRKLVEVSRGAASFFLEARERRARMASDLVSEMTPQPAGEPFPDADLEGPGARLGRYRLIMRIGEGGGGVVYEAEQEEPIHRRVAVKIVRLGMNTESVIARFEIERQALALMDHPNIARVLDAGSTASGRPYFVMELVTGEKITTYCNRKKLGNVQRLRLFVQVCQAIQHAHQKGIIHRDIKPSNVLVSEQDGIDVPKVIDFGIAKAINPQTFDHAVLTSHDQLFGTPAYMSPEQIDLAGLDVDTRSDIYSLGVLLYELLTSHTPFDREELASYGISKIRHTLLNTEAPRPSITLGKVEKSTLHEVAEERKAGPAQLINSIRGDLDWIVMKAMEKDRARRYQTVNGLALDVLGFLAHQPVTARPPGSLYLLGKFIRRNRLAVSAGVSLTVLLMAGLVISTMLYRRERQARREAQVSRSEENRLHLNADARANVARVAFLLDQGRIDEADALRQKYPLSSIEPSLEAAVVFRSLGDWNATHGRWDQAIQCFRLLMQANRLDDPSRILQGSDLIAIGAALSHYQERDYLEFRSEVKDYYLVPRNSLQAEHLLKASLLSPADADFLQRLQNSVEVMGPPLRAPLPSWAGLALGLYEYRCGRNESVLEACTTGLADRGIKNSCRASILCLSSMAYSRQGLGSKAKSALDDARKLIEESAGNDSVGGSSIPAYWFDWLIAGLLSREAGQEMEKN
ncbi:MAG: serine/threonine-protein kinase [Luteolibacter sp.]|uniref:serine/threonine protein kinase n=1 Tax=Luteolibacter sp. TaxID=1962973 RepID=UPI003267918A